VRISVAARVAVTVTVGSCAVVSRGGATCAPPDEARETNNVVLAMTEVRMENGEKGGAYRT
jgi:hypothetical protein